MTSSFAVLLTVTALLFVQTTLATRLVSPQACVGDQCSKDQWHVVERAQPHILKPLLFAIKQSNLDVIEKTLLEVSDPDSPSYGQYLSLEQVGYIIHNSEALQAVKSYLVAHGVHESQIEVTANGEFATVRVPVSIAEALLDAKFYVFANAAAPDVQVLRTDAFTVPEALEAHVDFIGETIEFPSIRSRHMHRGPIKNGYVTPELLNKVYNIQSNEVKDQRATQSVFESLGQDYSPSDLTMFQNRMGLPRSKIARVIGPNDGDSCEYDPNSCGEANLDVQYILAVATNSPTTYWSVEETNSLFVDWAVAVADDKNPPLVHSISYGGLEWDKSMMKRFSVEIQKLGLRGVTVLVSSGDDGSVGSRVRSGTEYCGFSPSFPATCPYVVAVGATQGPESGNAEVSCSSDTGGVITSGGGFSTVYARPSYQADAVDEFFKSANPSDVPPKNAFSSNGRGYPDVSVLGYNYIIVDGQRFVAESGTSASAPVFAALLSLINGELLAKGKPSLGFVNPLLYKLRNANGVFNDITEGNNHCAASFGTPNCCPDAGFKAQRGWDPVTGLGSVNFENLKNAVLNYADKIAQMRFRHQDVHYY